MFLSKIKVLRSHGKQYIRDLSKVELADTFRGRPRLSAGLPGMIGKDIEGVCPTGAFKTDPLSIDLGKCVFCGECSYMAPDHISFTNDYRIATNVRQHLVVSPATEAVAPDPDKVRKEVCDYFGKALKLREVSAGGDNSCEMELNATMNVNFDFQRYGIEFVASPRHADGIVITGPVTSNMAEALDICYCSIAQPKIIILAGTDAISGGIFATSPALDRSFLEGKHIDLFVPGNPVHPMTFIEGVRSLLRYGKTVPPADR